jgi:hypothetical protein
MGLPRDMPSTVMMQVRLYGPKMLFLLFSVREANLDCGIHNIYIYWYGPSVGQGPRLVHLSHTPRAGPGRRPRASLRAQGPHGQVKCVAMDEEDRGWCRRRVWNQTAARTRTR